MKGNLMDSVVSLASIAKRYDISIEISPGSLNNMELRLSKYYLAKYYTDMDNKMFRRYFVLDPDILMIDFEDICKRFVEECNEQHAEAIRNQ